MTTINEVTSSLPDGNPTRAMPPKCRWNVPTSEIDYATSLEFAIEQQAKRVEDVKARRAQSRLDEMALVRRLGKHALRGV